MQGTHTPYDGYQTVYVNAVYAFTYVELSKLLPVLTMPTGFILKNYSSINTLPLSTFSAGSASVGSAFAKGQTFKIGVNSPDLDLYLRLD